MSLKLESGILQMHSTIPSINNNESARAAGDIADAANTAANLEHAFFAARPERIYYKMLKSGSQVSVVEPTGKYAEKSFMVVAAGPNSLKNRNVTTEQIYQYPLDAQMEYWSKIITLLQQLDQDDNPRTVAIATENCMSQRTTREKRVPRTIALPHSQVFLLDQDHLEHNNDPNPEHLQIEQRALKIALASFDLPVEIQQGMEKILGEKTPHIEAHPNSPVGYSFEVSRSLNLPEIVRTLAVHHATYTELARAWFYSQSAERQAELIPQPSYRLYLILEEGRLVATVSPAFTSHAAVLEAADIVLKRSLEFPPRISPAEAAAVRNQVVQALTGKVDGPANIASVV